MKAKDVQKILSAMQETIADSFDHMAARFADEAGDEFEHLVQFSAAWKQLSKDARRSFVQQLLKSSALVTAGSVAAKFGMKLASRSQKDIRRFILTVADLIEPVAKKGIKRGKKLSKKAKKRLKNAVA